MSNELKVLLTSALAYLLAEGGCAPDLSALGL